MLMRFRPLAIAAVVTLLVQGLAGCASVNDTLGGVNAKLGAAVGDYLPQWAGGLPPDAPPRPGTAKYDEWIKEREKNRLLPASEREGSKGGAKTDTKADAKTDIKPDQSSPDPAR